MAGASFGQNLRVAAAVASTALSSAAFGNNSGVDDARRGLATTSSITDQPATTPTPAAAPDAAPKITAHQMVDVQVNGADGKPVTVRISSQPLATIQDSDRELLSSLAGGPSIRSNLGIAQDRKSMEFFNNNRLSAWDVTNNTPRIIGALTQRSPEVGTVVEALKAEGFTGAAIAMTHGSERGVLLLQTKENGVMALAYEIPSLRRDTPGTDARDAGQFKALMPGILRAMAAQNFGLEIAPGAAAPAAPVAAPTESAPSTPAAAPSARHGREVAPPPAPLTAEELSSAVAGRYSDKYGPALRGDNLADGTLPIQFVRDKQRIRLAGYIADLDAVRNGTNQDLRDVKRAISDGVVTNQARIVAVRMGRSPEEASRMTIADLPALRDDVEGLNTQADELKREYKRKQSALR